MQTDIRYRRSSKFSSEYVGANDENISEKPNENPKIIKIKSKSSLKLF